MSEARSRAVEDLVFLLSGGLQSGFQLSCLAVYVISIF
jgi:hypothetical protein